MTFNKIPISQKNYEKFLTPALLTGTKYQKSKKTDKTATDQGIKDKSRLSQGGTEVVRIIFSNLGQKICAGYERLKNAIDVYKKDKEIQWMDNVKILADLNQRLAEIHGLTEPDAKNKQTDFINHLNFAIEDLKTIEELNRKFIKGHTNKVERLQKPPLSQKKIKELKQDLEDLLLSKSTASHIQSLTFQNTPKSNHSVDDSDKSGPSFQEQDSDLTSVLFTLPIPTSEQTISESPEVTEPTPEVVLTSIEIPLESHEVTQSQLKDNQMTQLSPGVVISDSGIAQLSLEGGQSSGRVENSSPEFEASAPFQGESFPKDVSSESVVAPELERSIENSISDQPLLESLGVRTKQAKGQETVQKINITSRSIFRSPPMKVLGLSALALTTLGLGAHHVYGISESSVVKPETIEPPKASNAEKTEAPIDLTNEQQVSFYSGAADAISSQYDSLANHIYDLKIRYWISDDDIPHLNIAELNQEQIDALGIRVGLFSEDQMKDLNIPMLSGDQILALVPKFKYCSDEQIKQLNVAELSPEDMNKIIQQLLPGQIQQLNLENLSEQHVRYLDKSLLHSNQILSIIHKMDSPMLGHITREQVEKMDLTNADPQTCKQLSLYSLPYLSKDQLQIVLKRHPYGISFAKDLPKRPITQEQFKQLDFKTITHHQFKFLTMRSASSEKKLLPALSLEQLHDLVSQIADNEDFSFTNYNADSIAVRDGKMQVLVYLLGELDESAREKLIQTLQPNTVLSLCNQLFDNDFFISNEPRILKEARTVMYDEDDRYVIARYDNDGFFQEWYGPSHAYGYNSDKKN